MATRKSSVLVGLRQLGFRTVVAQGLGWSYPLLIFSVLCLFVTVWGTIGTEMMRYERAAILKGEMWRLFTAHLVHTTLGHLALNLAGLALLCVLFESRLALGWWLGVYLTAALGVGIGLLACSPEVTRYVGLSGVLHGFFAAAGGRALAMDTSLGLWILVLLGVKLLWEQAVGPLPGSEDVVKGTVNVDSHLYGACGGLMAYAISFAWKYSHIRRHE